MAYLLSGLDAVETWLKTRPSPVAQARFWPWLLDLAEHPYLVSVVPLPGSTALVHLLMDEDVDVAVTFVIVEEMRTVHLLRVETLTEPG